MSADPILFPGTAPLAKIVFEARCAKCGKGVDKTQSYIKNSIRKGHRIFCGKTCARAATTLYPGLTSLERQKKYQEVTAENRLLRSKSPCGTQAKYVMGCRCDVCRDAVAEYQREYRTRKKA